MDSSSTNEVWLTRRERQVVGYASRGWSNKLIAYELGVATSTVSTHLAHAASKLGATSRIAVMHHVHAGKTRSAVPAELTAAECAVVAGAVAGRSNADIAGARGVSRRTIENQLAAAMKKLKAGSRAALAALLLAQEA